MVITPRPHSMRISRATVIAKKPPLQQNAALRESHSGRQGRLHQPSAGGSSADSRCFPVICAVLAQLLRRCPTRYGPHCLRLPAALNGTPLLRTAGRLALELALIIFSSAQLVILMRPYTKRQVLQTQEYLNRAAGFAGERLSGVRYGPSMPLRLYDQSTESMSHTPSFLRHWGCKAVAGHRGRECRGQCRLRARSRIAMCWGFLAFWGGGCLHTHVSSRRTVQAFNQEAKETAEYERQVEVVYKAELLNVCVYAAQQILLHGVGYLGFARILFTCSAMVSEGALTVGGLVGFVTRSVPCAWAVGGKGGAPEAPEGSHGCTARGVT